MSFDLNCPYCDAEVKPLEDSREPNMNLERECPKCEKTFLYSIEYEPTYTAWEAPCLNGGEHDYKPMCGAPAEYFRGRHRCAHCDDETKLEAAESAPPETAKEACWCHRCHDGKPRVQMIVCPTCGNKRCPHASDHALICTGSNAQGQRGSIYGKPERCPPETT